MTALITITPPVGPDLGPFDLYSDVTGLTTTPFATGITLQQLIDGYSTAVMPNGTQTVRVQSTGDCTNYIDKPVKLLEKLVWQAVGVTDIAYHIIQTNNCTFYITWGDGETTTYLNTVSGGNWTNSITHTYITPYTGPITLSMIDLSCIFGMYDAGAVGYGFHGTSLTLSTEELGKLDNLENTEQLVTTVTGDVKYLPASLYRLVCYRTASTFNGDVKDLPRHLCALYLIGSTTITGDIKNLPHLTYPTIACGNGTNVSLNINGNNTLYGDIKDLVTVSGIKYQLTVGGLNTIDGDLNDLPDEYTTLDLKGKHTVHGDVGTLPPLFQNLSLSSYGQPDPPLPVYGDITTFPSTMTTIYLPKGNITVSGNVHDLNAPLLIRLDLGDTNTVNWNIDTAITDFPVLKYTEIGGNAVVTGAIINLPNTLTYLTFNQLANTNVTGTISDFAHMTNLQRVIIAGNACNITGDLDDLPVDITQFDIDQNVGSITGYTAGHLWDPTTAGLTFGVLKIQNPLAFSGAVASDLLIDINTSWTTHTGQILLTVTGGELGLTAPGTTAVGLLRGKGATVLIT